MPTEYKSALDAFQAAFEHEVSVSKEINRMMDAALAEKDYASVELLRWFVTEQVEEEAQTEAIVTQLKMSGASSGALLHLDRHLGKRKAD